MWEANDFNNTLEIKKQTRFVFRSDSLPGITNFTASVRVNGANFKTNQYLKTKVMVTFTKYPATEKASKDLDRAHVAYTEAREETESAYSSVISYLSVALKSLSDALTCLLYTSPSPRDRQKSRMPSSA